MPADTTMTTNSFDGHYSEKDEQHVQVPDPHSDGTICTITYQFHSLLLNI